MRFSCEALSENSTTILLAHFVYKTDVFTAEWSRSRTANRSAEWSRSRTANRSVEWSRSRTANRSSSTTIFRSTSRNDILSNSDISIMSTPNIIHSEDIIVSTTSVSPLISIPGFTLSSNTYDQLETNTAKDHTNSFIINNTITTSTTVLAALTSLSNCSVTVQFHYFHHIIYSGVIAILLCSIFVLLLLGTIFCFKKSSKSGITCMWYNITCLFHVEKHKPAPPVTNNLQSAIPNPILMLNSKESLQVDNPLLSHEYASLKPLTHLQDQQHQYFTLVGQEAAPYLIPLGKNSHQYSNVVLRDDILTSQEPRFQIIGSPISVNNVDGPVTEGEHLYTEVCPEN